MNKTRHRLFILLISLLLAACTRETVLEPPRTLPPPPNTPTATSPAQSGSPTAVLETATPPPQGQSSPSQTSTTLSTRVEATTTAISQTAESGLVDAAAVLTAPRLQNMTFSNLIIPSGVVTLDNGVYETQAAPGSATQIRVELSDTMALGDVGGEFRAAVILVSDGGGSGTFYTLHLVGLQDGKAHEMASVLLGDRVQLHDLTIVDGRIEIELTRAGPNDPLCCPSEHARLTYAWQDDDLVLVDETIGTPPPTAAGSTADLVERGLTLDVTGLASKYAWTIERAAPQADPPLPAHLLMTFDDFPPAEILTDNSPLLIIFPVMPYLEMAESAGTNQQPIVDQVARLWQLVERNQERSGAPQGWMPLLPPADMPVQDWTDFMPLDFVRGHGVRYLRQAGGDPIYTYQGITEDGRYLVSATWPLGTAEAPDLQVLDAMIATLALGEVATEP